MGWIILIAVLFIWFIIYNIKKEWKKSDEEERKDKIRGMIKIFYGFCYCTGFGDIVGYKSTNIKFFKDYIDFFNGEKKLFYKNIKDMYIQSESEMRQKVTAGRVLAFGVFALGMKKNETIHHNYLVLECYFEDRNKIDSIVFTGNNIEEVVRYFRQNNLNKDYKEIRENSSENDTIVKIEKLAELKEKGIITDEEFIEKKKELLSKII